MRPRFSLLAAVLVFCAHVTVARGDTLSFGGLITQSTPDGTGPASNNLSLNNITDGQAYVVTLVFAGTIAGPGSYNLTGASLSFDVASAPATETSFDSIHLTIVDNAGFDEFSLLGCLTTGSGCAAGNELTANFKIPDTMFNGKNVAALGLDQPHPLDLLEDDGVTDIHGSITTYSGPATAVTPVPEPGTMSLLGGAIAVLTAATRRSRRRRSGQTR